jgi:hypothetical protein
MLFFSNSNFCDGVAGDGAAFCGAAFRREDGWCDTAIEVAADNPDSDNEINKPLTIDFIILRSPICPVRRITTFLDRASFAS